jgi:hypothetical protein
MASLTGLFASELIGASMVIWLMAKNLYRLRLNLVSKHTGIFVCVALYLVCVAVATVHASTTQSVDRALVAFLRLAPPTHLPPEWGSSLTKEDRTRHSMTLARLTFESSGEVVNYFDPSGKLVPYEPSAKDHEMRTTYLERIRLLERQYILLFCTGVLWLLVPLLAIALGFSRQSERLFQPRTTRRSIDAS